MPAIEEFVKQGNQTLIEQMIKQWPFFKSRLSMLDMVFGKADVHISEAFEQRLVPDELKPIGESLRAELAQSTEFLLQLLDQQEVMEHDPKGKESIQIRATYLQPLHYLQIELLSRIRQQQDTDIPRNLEQAMMVAIGGIAIGMRNTG